MTAERRTATIAAVHDHLGWFKIPHTIDQVIGIYAEATAEVPPAMRHGLSVDDILASITRSAGDGGGGGKGGHSDPTWHAAYPALASLGNGRRPLDDGDETLGHMDADILRITEAAAELEQWACTTMGVAILGGSPVDRQSQINDAVSRLLNLRRSLEPAIAADPEAEGHVDWLIHGVLADSAEGLRVKAEDIWCASRGAQRLVVEQKKIAPCTHCSSWRTGTIAVVSGLCQQCKDFRGHHRCLPTEPIVRRWEYGQQATPGMIREAQAGGRRKQRAS